MPLVEVSRRLTRWIDREFAAGSSEKVLEVLRTLPEHVVGDQDPERIQASLVIGTAGDWYAFQRVVHLVHSDWRDALVGAGLGDEDWRHRLDDVLGTRP
jgi:hypothetical protein